MTASGLSEKRTLVTGRSWTMRELLTAARERFGPDAARYKTRQELLDALGLVEGADGVIEAAGAAPAAPATSERGAGPSLVTKDFFLPPR